MGRNEIQEADADWMLRTSEREQPWMLRMAVSPLEDWCYLVEGMVWPFDVRCHAASSDVREMDEPGLEGPGRRSDWNPLQDTQRTFDHPREVRLVAIWKSKSR